MRREKNEIKEDLKLKAGQGGKQEKRVCALKQWMWGADIWWITVCKGNNYLKYIFLEKGECINY